MTVFDGMLLFIALLWVTAACIVKIDDKQHPNAIEYQPSTWALLFVALLLFETFVTLMIAGPLIFWLGASETLNTIIAAHLIGGSVVFVYKAATILFS
jgi:hypothetical protein